VGNRWTFAAPAGKVPVGLQLYSVRKECEKDLPAVLAAVAKMGYQGVEFAGYYGRKAPELKKLLDDNGLKCCGTHTALALLTGDALKGTVEFHKTIGCKYIIVPGLPKKNTESKQALLDTAKQFDEIAAKLKPEGLFTGYHAHGGDFQKVDGETHWDILFGNTKPEVCMQLDTGNCLGGGGDPVAVLKKFPGRSKTIHLKPHGGKPGAAVGDDAVKWNEVFAVLDAQAATEWYIVEHEVGATPLESVKQCLDNLRKMGR
jgi:sugar phosphate isomerase/epimerase